MKKTKIDIDISAYPDKLRDILCNAEIYDSSCSSAAKVLFVDKECGYFVKAAKKGSLASEAEMWSYFHSLGLSSKVLSYISEDRDYLVTEKLHGHDCTERIFLENPTRLCDKLAESVRMLHEIPPTGCPVKNRLVSYDATVMDNYRSGNYDKTAFPDSFGYKSEKQAIEAYTSGKHLLKNDVLIHGDMCLPNIIFMEDFSLSGFIDVGNGGIGDRHIDIFWCVWSLFFNFGTDKYTERFLDAYGRELVDREALRTVAAAEVFG